MDFNFVNVFDYLANVAQVARKCPTTTLQHAYMRAFREWCQQTQWLKTNIEGNLIQGTQGLNTGRKYFLGSDPYLDIMGIYAMQGSQGSATIVPPGIQYWELLPSNPAAWDPNQQPSLPVTYGYIPEGFFTVNPLPQQEYQVNVTVILAPKEAAKKVPSAPLVKYSNDIEAGALEYLLAIPGQPWTDKQMALLKGKEFRSGISNGKAEAQRAYNTGAQRTVPRAFAGGGFRRALWRVG